MINEKFEPTLPREKILEEIGKHSINNRKWLENLSKSNTYIKTSIDNLNDLLGGLASTQFYIVAAQTNVGKTTLLISLLCDCIRAGKKCLYIPSEDSDSLIETYILLSLCNIPVSRWNNGELTEANIKYMEKKSEELEKVLFVEERTVNSVEWLKYGIEQYIAEAGVECIFYDYIGSIPDDSNAQEYKTLVKEADVLQRVCMDKNVCIVATCQTNSNVFQKEEDGTHHYTENDLAGSKGIANKAKVLIFMYNDNGKKMMYIRKAKRWLRTFDEKELTFRVGYHPDKLKIDSYYSFEDM